jgi:hypothetical protein
MHSLFPQSALTIVAFMVRSLWCGLRSRLGFSSGDVMIDDWVNGILSRFDDLLAQYRAGELPPEMPPRAVADGRATARHAVHVLTLSEMAALLAASPAIERVQGSASPAVMVASKRVVPGCAGGSTVICGRALRAFVAVRGDCGCPAFGNFQQMGFGAA